MAALTVLYDEGCGACTALATWLERRGRGVTAAPIGSPRGDRLLRDLSPAERYASVHAVDAHGRRRSGGDAVAPVLRALPGGRVAAAVATALPRPTAATYRLLARHRHVLGRLVRRS